MFVWIIISVLVALITALVIIIFDISIGSLYSIPYMNKTLELVTRHPNNYTKLTALFFTTFLKKHKSKVKL